MEIKEQKTNKVVLPQLSNPKENMFYANYDHIVKHDCDYVFHVRKEGNVIEKVKLAQNVNTFVLPSFKDGAYTIVQGAFEELKDVTLIVTGNAPIKICHNAFVAGAEVKLILPKDMALFHVRQKAQNKDKIFTIDFPVIAKQNFHLSKYIFTVAKVDEMADEKLPFKISVDKTKIYDRTSRTTEECRTENKENQNTK